MVKPAASWIWILVPGLLGPIVGPSRIDATEEGDAATARRLLHEVAEQYKTRDQYADSGTFTIAATVRGQVVTQAWPMSFRFIRPGHLAIHTGDVRVVSDGKTLLTVITPTKRYVSEPAPERIQVSSLSEGPAGALLFGGPGAPAVNLILRLLFGEDPATILPENRVVARLGPDFKHGDRTLKTLILDSEEGVDLSLRVHPDTKQIERIDLVTTDTADVPEVTGLAITWNSGSITTASIPAETFAVKPPEGFRQVSELQAAAKPAEPRHELIGKPAPEFTLTTIEPGGATKRVTKADLTGKVVLLDFWATWCGPCLKELPEVATLIADYAKAGKPVVVIAASVDRKPADGTLRGLVEATLKDKNLKLVQPPVGLVALDSEMALSEAFKIEVLPTAFLIDRKGVVQAVHFGATDDIRETLKKEIDILLDGKALIDDAEPPRP